MRRLEPVSQIGVSPPVGLGVPFHEGCEGGFGPNGSHDRAVALNRIGYDIAGLEPQRLPHRLRNRRPTPAGQFGDDHRVRPP